MSSQKLVVFDLDGTLNRTELYAVPAHHRALAELGLPDRSDEIIVSAFGACAQEGVQLLTGRSDPAFVKEYMQCSGRHEQELIRENAGSYEGVPEALRSLREDGYTTAVCSNSSERYIRMVLGALHLLEEIDLIQPLVEGMDKNGTLGLLLAREQPCAAVMVGDRVYDRDAARANGLPFIGCLYGFRPEEVRDADAAVSAAGEIPAAVKRLIG